MSNITKAIAALTVVAGLGVAALPLSSFAAESQPVKVTAEISSSISVSADTTDIPLGTLTKDGNINTASTKVTINTTSKNYSLVVKDSDENVGLYTTNEDGTPNMADGKFIPAGAVAKGATFWGVRTDGATAFQGVTPYSGNGVELASKTDGTAAAGEVVTNVEFGASYGGSTSLDDGIYEGAVVFVATALD